MPINKLNLASGTVTSAGAETGVAVGSITGDYTVKLLFTKFIDPSASARIAIEECTDNLFAAPRQLAVFNISGGFNNVEGVMLSFKKRDACGTDLFGTAGAYARLNFQELNGFSPSLSYESWVEF